MNKAEKEGEKHRGLVKVEPDIASARNHIAKAEHNLKTTLYLQRGGFTDWCSSTLFYTIYHCFLSILAKQGYESRNQECTFAVLHSLIEDGLVSITKEEMEKVSDLNVEEDSETVVNIRERYQYSTTLSLADETIQELLDLAGEILDKTKVMLEE